MKHLYVMLHIFVVTLPIFDISIYFNHDIWLQQERERQRERESVCVCFFGKRGEGETLMINNRLVNENVEPVYCIGVRK